MQLLIDTQILIWFQLGHNQLNPTISDILSDRHNEIYVSDVSLYEITIKQTVGKLDGFSASLEQIIEVANQDNFRFVALSQQHLLNYKLVPFHTEHRDPFDRLIISTAKTENLPLVSADAKFDYYKDYVQLIKA